MAVPILILGASTRAAAQSARRAGLHPVCADLFADEDLRAVADVLPLDGYPQGLPGAARHAPASPWMYTGALENHPGIIRRISAERPLWGNAADVVRKVRDPLLVESVLRRGGLLTAAVRAADDPPVPDGSWCLKPLRGAAGRGIVVWDARGSRAKTLREPHYFQERLTGTPISAVYVAFPGRTVLAGISRQLPADARDSQALFRYGGSIGPIQPDPRTADLVQRTGEVLAEAFGLRGLFGCDFIDEGSKARLTEVNPRYTASVEIFEHAHGMALLDLHRRACELLAGANDRQAEQDASRLLETVGSKIRSRRQVVGKLIVYAERDVRVPSLSELFAGDPEMGIPPLADIPAPGTLIPADHPICTVLAAAGSLSQCQQTLAERADTVRRALAG